MKYKISPSLIGMLLECPRCLWMHFKDDIQRPRGIFPSLPGGMDLVLKDYFDKYRAKGDLPPEIKGKITDAKLYDQDMQKLNKWREIDFGRGGFRAEIPEYDVLLKGAIDELMVNDKGEYVPFDFKTRGFPTKDDTHKHYQHQLDLYALLFEKNGLKPAKEGYLLFFWPKEYKEHHATFNTDLIKMNVSAQGGMKVLEEFNKIISGPRPQSHTDCAYCVYRAAEISAD